MLLIVRFRTTRAALAAPLLALVLAACGVAASDEATPTVPPTATQPPATPTPAGPTATPTPDLAVLLRDGGIAIVEDAYNRLLDGYIDPLEPAPLLRAAWNGLAQEAAVQGMAVPAAPALGGGRAEAFASFAGAYVPLANAAPDATKLRFAALRSMAQSLGDCHTFFLNPVASDTLIDTRAGKGSVGIGIELSGMPPLITEVIAGGPAAEAGVLVGDRIAAVDGREASGLGPAGALDLINGAEGTSVRLQLTRPGEASLVDLTIGRRRVVPQNIETRVIGGTVGYVRIRNFVDGGVADALGKALRGFEAEGVTGWIIDLRGNPGGRLDTDAMSLFIRDGVVVRDRGRDGNVEEERANPERTLPVVRPAVLLANNRTGSVAEIFAAALQEHGVARVVGGTTNGCVGYTDVHEFGDGSSLAITTHVHMGPVTNAPLNGVGVVPDITAGRTLDDIAAGRDPQLEAAIAALAP